VQVGMCDGGVKFVADSIDHNVWRAAGTTHGSEAGSSLE